MIVQAVKRVDDKVKEVILATNSTPEGEATASFISSKLEELDFNFVEDDDWESPDRNDSYDSEPDSKRYH